MRIVHRNVFSMLLLLAVLAGCGGGGGNAQSTGSTGPYINVVVVADNTGVGGTLQYRVWGSVNETSMTGLPITDAVVTVNGAPLTYNTVSKQYFANNLPSTLPDVNGKLNLTVVIGGSTYTAMQDAPDTLPVITLPATLTASSINTVTWTQNVSSHGLTPTFYYLTVFPSGATGTTVMQTMTTNTFVNIPANTFTGGTNYCFNINSDYNVQAIANTAQLSGFYVLAAPISICKVAA